MLGTCHLREGVGDGLTVHALGEQAQLTRDAGNSRRLLRRSDFGHSKGYKVLGAHAVATLHDSRVQLLCKTLVCYASLRNRLSARLGELGVHLGEHVHDLSVALARLNGVSDSVGAGNAVVLGSHSDHLSPPVWADIFSRARVAREWHCLARP